MTRPDDEKTGRRTIVRGGVMPPSASRPVVAPLHPSVVYASASADALDAQYEGRVAGYTYAREGHPNADMLAETARAQLGLYSPNDVIISIDLSKLKFSDITSKTEVN